MGVFLIPDDLEPFATIDEAKAEAMISDAEAMASLAAPCITDSEFQADEILFGALKAVLRGAILRWHEAGSGALQTTSTQTGPFAQQQGFDTRQVRKGMFWPSEIEQLRDLCKRFSGAASAGAFAIDTAPSSPVDGLWSRPDLWFQWVHPVPTNQDV